MPHQILVVDDDPEVRKLLDFFLGDQLGYEVQTAEGGLEALEYALKKTFDLCILDVTMPDISGPETYTRLKSLLPEIEGVFFTADRDFEDAKDFLRFSLPKERVLNKPIEDFADLTQLIVSILGPPKS